ncbi:5'-nucleotidase domain-containing protein 3, partial [Coemansia sp. RSA 2681]
MPLRLPAAELARRIAPAAHKSCALGSNWLAHSCYTTNSAERSVRYLQQLQARYDLAHDLCLKDPVQATSANARRYFRPTARDIFPNTEVQLSKVRTYGLDLDYTLASYTEKLPETIYTMIRDVLVNSMLYPPALKALKYDRTFAIRGISYDRETGWLFKLDSNYNIAMDTIHYGREPLRDLEEVFALHG